MTEDHDSLLDPTATENIRRARLRQAVEGLLRADPFATCQLLGVRRDRNAPMIWEWMEHEFELELVDPLLLVRTGRAQAAHVELLGTSAVDVLSTMLITMGQVMARRPGTTVQPHLVVLDDTPLTGHDDIAATSFELDVKVFRVGDQDPFDFFRWPTLVPLAMLDVDRLDDRGMWKYEIQRRIWKAERPDEPMLTKALDLLEDEAFRRAERPKPMSVVLDDDD